MDIVEVKEVIRIRTKVYLGMLASMASFILTAMMLSGSANAITHYEIPSVSADIYPVPAPIYADFQFPLQLPQNIDVTNGDDVSVNVTVFLHNNLFFEYADLTGFVDYWYTVGNITSFIKTDNIAIMNVAPLSAGFDASSSYTYTNVVAGATITIDVWMWVNAYFIPPPPAVPFVIFSGWNCVTLTYNLI